MTEQYCTPADLKKDRGWTDSCVGKLLGTPDATRPNPHFKSAPPTKLFLRERVLAVEQSEQWTALAAQAECRRAGSQKAVETKTARLLTYVNGLDVQVPVLPMLELIQSACESYNAYKEEAYVHLNSKVYAAIAAVYPKLTSEYERQAERKGGWGGDGTGIRRWPFSARGRVTGCAPRVSRAGGNTWRE